MKMEGLSHLQDSRTDDVVPELLGEVLVLVCEHRLDGVGPRDDNRAQDRRVGKKQRPVLPIHIQREVRSFAEKLDGVTQKRQARVPRGPA